MVLPEILDGLPASDPAARASRRDLRFLNGLMGTHRWLRCAVRQADATARMVELGAGDGMLAQAIGPRTGAYVAIDLQPAAESVPGWVDWRRGDIRDFKAEPGDIVVANLVLHHFSREDLAAIGANLAQAAVILAAEPARRLWNRWSLRALSLAGLHAVTRHDGWVSVGAGFRRGELAAFLGLGPDWWVAERESLRGCVRFRAKRG